ncbi:MAG: hypothetical protein KGJ57_20155 [Sphingomonadales bacterium]|nr:hypothetical protein [Sphingomonadales bacterium]MDE2171710.1 hypothetical protein [Sphingomonadales bacterium]
MQFLVADAMPPTEAPRLAIQRLKAKAPTPPAATPNSARPGKAAEQSVKVIIVKAGVSRLCFMYAIGIASVFSLENF